VRKASEMARGVSGVKSGKNSPSRSRFREGDPMFLTLAIVLAVLWGLGWFAFHVAGGLIHLLLIVALISVVVHFVRGRSARA
jgi:hypothetical protein